jgi:uncharacterized membrane protein
LISFNVPKGRAGGWVPKNLGKSVGVGLPLVTVDKMGVEGVPVTFVGVTAVPVVRVANNVSVAVIAVVGVSVEVAVRLTLAVLVALGTNVGVAWELSVCAATVRPEAIVACTSGF